MKYRGLFVSALAAACFGVAAIPVGNLPATPVTSKKITAVCTTTQMSAVVDAVGGSVYETRTVIPHGMCPGHFELSPGEARALLEAPVLFCHGYEHFLNGLTLRGARLQPAAPGNWMIPDVHVRAIREITAILSRLHPSRSDEFAARANSYADEVIAARDSIRDRFGRYRGAPVICSVMNRDFVEWMGFRVVAEYPRDEEVSLKELRKIVAEGKKSGITLVIDNRQSGGKIGRAIAEDIDVPMVVLTNFPEPESPAHSDYPYIRSLIRNCGLVAHALDNDSRAVSKER